MSEKRPLNVLFLITSMPVGGAEVLLSNLVQRMDRNRMIPQIGCLKEMGPLGKELSGEITVHSHLLNHKYDFGIVNRLAKLMKSEQIDAVVTVGAGDKMFWGRLAARQARVPVVLSALHSTGWPDGVGRMNRWLTPITDGFIAVARQHGQFLVEQEKFPSHKVFVIPNGIDTDRFSFCSESRVIYRRKWGISHSAPVAGIVAALRPEKNHLLFLRVAANVIHRIPQAHFVIVGEGPEREKLEIAVSDHQLANHVHFLGNCSDIPGVLSAIDLFALTSQNEASPVSILEAMACRRPVVAPDVGSISESVLDGVTGHLVPVGNAEEMTRRWIMLLDNEEKRNSMGDKSREHVEKSGSLNAMTEGYQQLIEQLYDRKRNRRSKQTRETGEIFHSLPVFQTTDLQANAQV